MAWVLTFWGYDYELEMNKLVIAVDKSIDRATRGANAR